MLIFALVPVMSVTNVVKYTSPLLLLEQSKWNTCVLYYVSDATRGGPTHSREP